MDGDCQPVNMTPARQVARMEVCAPHPSALFPRETTDLLSSISAAPVVAVGPPNGATSLEQIVAAMEEKRRCLGIECWAIWGMSGGSFLAQLSAHMYPTAVTGLILASSGPYFRTTVEDPDCILSPHNPAWSSKLSAAGLLDGEYETGPTVWEIVTGVGWVFRRASGATLVVSPEPSAELQAITPAPVGLRRASMAGHGRDANFGHVRDGRPGGTPSARRNVGGTFAECALRRN